LPVGWVDPGTQLGATVVTKDWRFTSETYPTHGAVERWRETMGRIGLQSDPTGAEGAVHDVATLRTSPLGIEFVRISSGPQTLGRAATADPSLLFAMLPLEGETRLGAEPDDRVLTRGDLLIAPPGEAFSLAFGGRFRLLALRVPLAAFRARLVTPRIRKLVHVPGRLGIGHVLSQLLTSVGESFDSLSADDFRPIDIAATELLTTCLAAAVATGTSPQAAILHRVCQEVEARLGDPLLSPAQIARDTGLSERYVQKLFETGGENFTSYVRRRRLERCREDFENPQRGHLSITDICFHWGFNDAAHFSRSFRTQFNMSPRECRQQMERAGKANAVLNASRGWPQEALSLARDQSIGLATRMADLHRKSDAPISEPVRSDPDGGYRYHYLPANDETVHWGYFSHALKPVVVIESGDWITVETLTQHATDDYERMVAGDVGAESVFHWTETGKNVNRRGAGPMDASVFGRGAGEGFGVHICTGPIAIRDASPGDVIEVRIRDVLARPSANPFFAGRVFGSNAATWWGFHYDELLDEPRVREIVTLYELDFESAPPTAQAVYSYRWTPQTDPYGVVHATIDYPGVRVDPATIDRRYGILRGVRVPVRAHFGVIGVAPRESTLVDSTPPSYFGGNIDNWRVGKGSSVYLPVSMPGGLLSVGDPHASQGDGELSGTAIECSLTGIFQIILHKKGEFAGKPFADLTYPLIETADEWILLGFSHPNHLAELGEKAQSEIYSKSSLDLAMKDAFRKMRRLLMTTRGLSEDEAISLMSVAVDFGVTQVVDGNWGVHAILRKALFSAEG
jgi:acetamidase/formamidase/AraC-like DNA-binding protein